jgi:hypothetical protein
LVVWAGLASPDLRSLLGDRHLTRFGVLVKYIIPQICEIRPLARDSLFEVVNVAADLGALEAKRGNYVSVGHAPNLGADRIHFLWQMRHNTGNFTKIGPFWQKAARQNVAKSDC